MSSMLYSGKRPLVDDNPTLQALPIKEAFEIILTEK